MLLIRGAFWIGVAVMLLPTEERNQAKLMSTVSSTAERVITFCDRNPVACRKGQEYWAIFTKKAEFGARMVMDVANERSRRNNADPQFAVAKPEVTASPLRLEPTANALQQPAGLPQAKVKTEAIVKPGRSADATDTIDNLLRDIDARHAGA